MKIYRVGGCVRDKLLGSPIQDQDFVVVGASEQDMLRMGFTQVGKDFPVFLHPSTSEEYALARKERKTGAGYHGFACETKNVTLEEDLFRRDLTINAMAMDDQGNLIDPFDGQEDLKNKVLRHVSVHFKEDPVRILRIARFSARYGFSVAPETKAFLQEMVKDGLCDELSAERVWKEFEKVLKEPYPYHFVQVLDECGAWIKIKGPLLQAKEALENLKVLQSNPLSHENERELDALLCMIKNEKTLETDLKNFKVPTHFIREIKIIRQFEHKPLPSMTASDWMNWIRQTKALHQIQESQKDLIHLMHWQSKFHGFKMSEEQEVFWKESLSECVSQIKSMNLKALSKSNESLPMGTFILNEQMKVMESWLLNLNSQPNALNIKKTHFNQR